MQAYRADPASPRFSSIDRQFADARVMRAVSARAGDDVVQV